MFCDKCGKEINDNVKFCPYCGNIVEDSNVVDESYPIDQKNKKGKKSKIAWKIIIVILFLVVIVVGCIATLEYFNVINIPAIEKILLDTNIKKSSIDVVPEEYRSERVDPEEYYRDNADLEDVVPVKESKGVISEKECLSYLKDRGFGECEVYSEYDMEGCYLEDMDISKWSISKHPMYTCLFISKENEVWSINIVEDQITATPVTYNAINGKNIIITENEYVKSYDSGTNKFYKSIPKEEVLDVNVIKHIDADSLNELGYEGINNL